MKTAIVPAKNPYDDRTRGEYGETVEAVHIVLEGDEDGKYPAGSVWVFDAAFGMLHVDPEEYLDVVTTDE